MNNKLIRNTLMIASLIVLTACGGGGGSADTLNSTSQTELTTSNIAPVANAGADQNVITASIVTLDGSKSSDANQDNLTYAWSITSKPDGSSDTLSDTTIVNPRFTADVNGVYVFNLIVNDGSVNSTASSVTVTATATTANAAPVANAGINQNVVTSSTVTLDGSNSSDANQDNLTYTWSITSKPSGSSVALSDTTAPKPTFVPDTDGAYVFNLTVNDGSIDSTADSITVTATTTPKELSLNVDSTILTYRDMDFNKTAALSYDDLESITNYIYETSILITNAISPQSSS